MPLPKTNEDHKEELVDKVLIVHVIPSVEDVAVVPVLETPTKVGTRVALKVGTEE